AVAAALVLAVAGGWWAARVPAAIDPPPAATAAPQARDAQGRIWPADRPIALAPGERLRLDWDDGCRIDLDGAQARLRSGEPRLALDAGRLRAEVTPRSASLAVTTPAGTVEVIGTAFTVAVGDAAVDVAVEHGRVRWRGGVRERILAAGATRAEPRERLGWRWEPGSDRPGLRERVAVMLPQAGPGPVLEMVRNAGGIGYTNISAPWPPETEVAVIDTVQAGPRSELNLIAVESDGDGWLVLNRPLTATGPRLLTWRDPAPGDLRFRNGDGVWDPLRMERLIVSLWGDPATVRIRPADP
ncbi:MAG: FecR protein, partial [Planctomycetota bacterium]